MILPPKCPVARAAEPLCVAPRRIVPADVDDGSDAIGVHTWQIAEFPDTMQYNLTTEKHRSV